MGAISHSQWTVGDVLFRRGQWKRLLLTGCRIALTWQLALFTSGPWGRFIGAFVYSVIGAVEETLVRRCARFGGWPKGLIRLAGLAIERRGATVTQDRARR